MTTTETTRWLDIPGAPSIAGVRARAFRGIDDWQALSELTIATNTLDGVPWLPSPDNLRLEIGEADGTNPFEDIVLVEQDGRLIGACGVQRVVRDGVPTYEVWGNVDPSVRRQGIGTWLLGRNLDRVRERTVREDPEGGVMLGSFADEAEVGHRALLADFGFTPVRHFFLMRRDLLVAIPEAAAPGRHRDPAGDRRPAPTDRRRRGGGVPRPLGPPREDRQRLPRDLRPGRARHRPVGRRLGRRRDRRRRPELDLARGERSPRGQARLAGAHQRPPAVAQARAGSGHHGGVAAGSSATPAWRKGCSGSIPRTRTVPSGCTKASVSSSEAGPRPIAGPWTATTTGPRPSGRSAPGSRACRRPGRRRGAGPTRRSCRTP